MATPKPIVRAEELAARIAQALNLPPGRESTEWVKSLSMSQVAHLSVLLYADGIVLVEPRNRDSVPPRAA